MKCQRLKKKIVQKAMAPLIKLTDQCMKREVPAQQLPSENVARSSLDLIALLDNTNCELIQRRCDSIRPDVNNQYQQICAEHVAFTDLLLGNDLQKQIQAVSSTNRVGQRLQNTNKASENDHHKSRFSKNGQTHRPHFNNHGHRCHKAKTPYRKLQKKLDQKQ